MARRRRMVMCRLLGIPPWRFDHAAAAGWLTDLDVDDALAMAADDPAWQWVTEHVWREDMAAARAREAQARLEGKWARDVAILGGGVAVPVPPVAPPAADTPEGTDSQR